MTLAGEALAWQPVLLGKVFGAVLVVATLIRLGSERRGELPRALLLLGALFALCALSFFWSQAPELTLRAVRHLGLEALLLTALALSPGRARLGTALASGAVLGALLLGCVLLVHFATGQERAMRIVVGEGDPNIQARQIGLGLLLLFAVAQRCASESPSRRALGTVLAGAVLLGLALAVTGSRGGLVAVSVGLLLLAVRPPAARPWLRGVAGLGLLALGLGLAAVAAHPGLRAPLAGSGDDAREVRSSGRDAIWANSLEIVRDHPLLGVGVAAAPAVYDSYRDRRMAEGGLHSKAGRDPHSLYLQLLVGVGPLGLLLFLAAVGLVLRERRGSPQAGVVAAVLVFVLLSAATQSTLELKDFWLALAWAMLAASLRAGDPARSA